MRRQCCECRRLWPLGMLLSRTLVHTVMEVERDNRVCVVVWDMVVHRGMSHWVMEQVMVMVMVMGPKRQDRHWQGAQ